MTASTTATNIQNALNNALGSNAVTVNAVSTSVFDVTFSGYPVNGLLLPVVLFFVLRLANDRVLMGHHANGPLARTLGIGVAALASVLSLALVAVSLLP